MEKEKKLVTMSRVWFCPKCATRGSPKTDDMFMVFGSSNNDFHIFQIGDQTKLCQAGFTPHIIQVQQVTEKGIVITHSCGISGCDVNIEKIDGQWGYEFLHVDNSFISHESFKALVQFTDTGYKLE